MKNRRVKKRKKKNKAKDSRLGKRVVVPGSYWKLTGDIIFMGIVGKPK